MQSPAGKSGPDSAPDSGPDSSSKPAFVGIAKLADLPEGQQLSVYVGLKKVLLCRAGDRVFAMRDMCPHALQPLLGSKVENGVIKCQKHGATFDLVSGRPTNGVTNAALEIYAVNLRDESIAVAVR
jgi:nitrite reductase/ring-hydroxylating ferredoxin subunit